MKKHIVLLIFILLNSSNFMTATQVVAPKGMSVVNAFAALYTEAKVIGFGKHDPESGQEFTNPRHVVNLLKRLGGNIDYMRGKYMKIYFNNFPNFNSIDYDTFYGFGACKRALETYHARKPEDKIDPKDEVNFSLNIDF